MTAKSKTRKAKAVKGAARAHENGATKATSGTKREGSKIGLLIARYRFLEADEQYQAEIAKTDEGSDEASMKHDAEQQEIIAELRTFVPQNSSDLVNFFEFVLDEIKITNSFRCDYADLDLLVNICEAIRDVFWNEENAARHNGMVNMREFLRSKIGVAFEVATESNIMQRIGYGNA